MFLRLATKSLLNRKGSVLLTLLAMTVSIFVMLGVEHIREQAKTSFTSTVSGTDLIVGTRTGSLNLLLYSIFRMGTPTNNISWQAFERLSADSAVKWSIPLSLGDSHKGYRVLGTDSAYFSHFSYGKQQTLTFNQGKAFAGIFDVVLGAEVARALGYKPGDKLALSHGIGSTSFSRHADKPFTVTGILNATGTPVDQTLHVSLQGLEAVHTSGSVSSEDFDKLTPKSITAVLLGLKSKMTVFHLQRKINTDNREPLLAILPGVALSELWQAMAILEGTLRLISVLVFVSALLGLSAMLLASIRERAQEIRLLRTMGASPVFLYWFVELEAMLITLVSVVSGAGLLYLCLSAAKGYLLAGYGLSIDANVLSLANIRWLSLVFLFAFIAAFPPSLMAYRGAKQSCY
ncbi:ABC transporter permease [Thalassomonas viridans]|uniref:ABC transporter permease n=1 Tax=Thalassomonas viridans TaxID=137584 RepID=A0AAE9Z2X8_9GAMM|nr:ABC transporter permease [Thalassomonas viridans]WDE05094.1 ABC transporter permease [Thalassomonas viridans]